MCTSLFLLDAHPSLALLLLFNRDEFYNRCVSCTRLGCRCACMAVALDQAFVLHQHPLHHSTPNARAAQTHRPGKLLGGPSRDPGG